MMFLLTVSVTYNITYGTTVLTILPLKKKKTQQLLDTTVVPVYSATLFCTKRSHHALLNRKGWGLWQVIDRTKMAVGSTVALEYHGSWFDREQRKGTKGKMIFSKMATL